MKQLKSSDFKSFIYGTLLGDSYIHRSSKSSFGCRQITKDLILYKKKIIELNLPSAEVKLKKIPNQELYRLDVKHEYFRKIYSRFYDENGKKYVSNKVLKSLKPNGLAVWFADDGCSNLIGINNFLSGKKDRLINRRIELCTDGFSPKCNARIIQFLCKYLNMSKSNFSLIPRRENQLRTRLSTFAGQKLLYIIYKEFLNNYPSMLYKMDMGYRDDLLYTKYVSESYRELFEEIKIHEGFIDRLNPHDIV